MSLTLGFAFRIFIVALIFGGVHFLVWKAFLPLLPKKRPARFSIALFLAAMTLGIPYNIWLVRFLPVSEKGIFSEATHAWLGFVFYFLLYFLVMASAFKILSFAFTKRDISATDRQARRQFLNRSLGGVVGTLTSVTAGKAYAQARQGPALEKVDVVLERLPIELNGFRIVQVSDLHVGPLIDKDYVKNVVSMVMQCKPHAIVLTGDFVDGSVAALSEDVEPLRELKASHGVYFVTGNHDFYSGYGPWSQKFRELGFTILENEHVKVGNESQYFYLAGVHDPTAVKFGLSSNVELAVKGCMSDKLRILLAHQPKSVYDAEKFDIDFQISGHTHAGQMWPLGLLVSRVQPYLKGLNHHSEKLQVYVNRGTGFWGPPMRLASVSEITEFTLHRHSPFGETRHEN